MEFSLSQIRLIAFYALTLALVLGLFKAITAHGETLKAPPQVGGQYRLQSPALMGCAPLVLDLQQSGIFLNGAIAPQRSPTNSTDASIHPTRPTLEGRWQNNALTLKGSLDSACLRGDLALTASPLSGDRLQGTVSVAGRSLPFLATRLAETSKSSLH